MATSLISAILGSKCPKCRQGKMFRSPVYHLGKFTEMNKNCEVCQTAFEPEPQFYQGAMYISYGFSVASFVIVFAFITIFFGRMEMKVYTTAIITTVILSIPFSFRYSRTLYLYLAGKASYDANLDKK